MTKENKEAKAKATKKVQAIFKELDESGRLREASKFIHFCCDNGSTVNFAMAFLKEAEVMSDTELCHAITL